MNLKISYAKALRSYPDKVREVLEARKKSKAQARNDAPETLRWAIDWCVRISGCPTLGDILGGKKDESTSEVIAHLQASKGHGYWCSQRFAETPKEILELEEKAKAKEAKEKARYDALTPEQQEAETAKLVGQLFKGGGFMAITPGGVAGTHEEFKKLTKRG